MASKTYIGDLYGTASLDTRSYMAGLAAMRAKTGSAFAALGSTIKKALGAFIAVEAVRGMTRMTTETLRNVASLDKLSQATGIATTDLQAYVKASEFAGTTDLDLAKALREQSKARLEAIRGSREQRRAFADLGITAKDLGGTMGGDLFERVVENLAQIHDESLRSSVAFKIFGREAEHMNGLLLQGAGAFGRARDEIEKTGAALSREDLVKVRVASQALGDLNDAWGVFKTKLAVALTPLIYQVSQLFTAMLGDPEIIRRTADVISKVVDQIATIAVTLPTRIGIAWRECYIGALKVKRLLDGGITGMLNPETQATTEEIQKLTGELDELYNKLDFQLKSDPTGFLEAFRKAWGDIGTIFAGKGGDDLSPALKRFQEDLEGVQRTIDDGLTESLTNLFTEGKAGFRALGQAIIKDLLSALIRVSIVAPLLDTLRLGSGESGGGILGTIFGGFRAGGGGVDAGRAYVVGEKRPELFVPRSAGTILPDAQRALGRGAGSRYYIDARGADAAGMQRLERMILALHGSIERRSVNAVRDAGRRRAQGFA